MMFWDLARQSRFRVFSNAYIRDTKIVLLVYSITS